MAKSKIQLDVDSIESESMPMVEVQKEAQQQKRKVKDDSDKEFVNCLKRKRICISFIPKDNGIITDKKHALYGGMAEGTTRTFVVPKLSNGQFVNVLTDSEKEFLEEVLGLDDNALSIYRKKDNVWSTADNGAFAKVKLTKEDNFLDLSIPEDYIKYKILLANKDFIAPSVQALQEYPKATYQFVIKDDTEVNINTNVTVNRTLECYEEFAKMKTDRDKMSYIIETIEHRTLSDDTALELLMGKINQLIQSDTATFHRIVTDKMLDMKMLIRKAVRLGVIYKRSNLYYTRKGEPLCSNNEEPTLDIAAKFLNNPRSTEILANIHIEIEEREKR